MPGGLQRADGLGRDLEGTLGQAPTSFWGVLAYFLVYLHFFYIEIMTENVQRCKKLACGFLTGLSFRLTRRVPSLSLGEHKNYFKYLSRAWVVAQWDSTCLPH